MTTGHLDVDGDVERFNVAIAEAGYPECQMWTVDGRMYASRVMPAPPAVIWQASYLAKAGEPHPCWSCWDASNRADPLGPDWERRRWASDCVTGRGCHFPDGPARPPRELLARS